MSEYDRILSELKEKVKVLASEYVPKLYRALLDEWYTPKAAKEKIMRDCAGLWTEQTIWANLPEESKDSKKREAGKKGAETRAKMTLAELPPPPPLEGSEEQEEERPYIPPAGIPVEATAAASGKEGYSTQTTYEPPKRPLSLFFVDIQRVAVCVTKGEATAAFQGLTDSFCLLAL
ncbi:hypothetical protein Ngar_c13470 [Candidatus Nitrososphaera gargensis Ga9.2]|uniref:Uncharacterized protein n=1 Tax=Nitrososphaera gargensis (strain Ga9.2) TaxID=1237085 RepID=K0IEU4_NITGG|nr:hypothetical protein [Candidatus Nitrososphaera gargensis]AFU58285.1 hypothetical protein Ngar_c13470 [Candidatus Nitrososphaera gargensis Ga9.2]